jgi:hypothetical protein
MERIAGDVELRHLGVADLDALFVGARVERALDFQSGLGGRRPNQLDDGEAIDQRPAAPVLGDRTEQPVLDLVPLRGAGGRGSEARSRRRSFAVRASTAARPPRSRRRNPR